MTVRKVWINVETRTSVDTECTDATEAVHLRLRRSFIPKSHSAFPFACWISKSIIDDERNRSLFSHPVIDVSTLNSRVCIFTHPYERGRLPRAVVYAHRHGDLIERFDRLSRPDFLKSLTDRDFNFTLEPIHKPQTKIIRSVDDEGRASFTLEAVGGTVDIKSDGRNIIDASLRPKLPRPISPQRRPPSIHRGAWKRAEDAGLIPSRSNPPGEAP